jgi:hypothetical protein
MGRGAVGLDGDGDAGTRQGLGDHRPERMLAPELAGGADRRRIAVIGDLMVGDVEPGVVAIASRLGEGVIRPPVVVVVALGQQGGQDVRQR